MKPEEKKPKDVTDEVVDELTDEESETVVGGATTLEPKFTTVAGKGCASECTRHQGSKADWAAVG